MIPAVRGLDLSNRPWENGYNAPQGADDPQEDHPYMFIDHFFGKKPPFFQMTDLEKMNGGGRPGKTPCGAHAGIINEYDWLWLHRDGTPTRAVQAGLRTPVGNQRHGPAAVELNALPAGRPDRVLAGASATMPP